MALLAARLEYEAIATPLKMQAVFARGHKVEALTKTILQDEYEWTIVSDQLEVTLPVSSKIAVVGHVDGLRWDKDDLSRNNPIIEIKSQNQDEWDRFDVEGWNGGFFPRYKWQISSYMHAENRPVVLVRALWDGEKVIDLAFHDIFEPWYSIADIRAKVLRIEGTAQTGVLAAECTPLFPCPYFYLHEEVDRELVDDDTVQTLARRYEDLRREVANTKGQQEATRRALREAVGDDTKIRTQDGTKVTFYMAANPPSLDKVRLKSRLQKEGDSIENYYNRTKSERIKVTLPAEKDGSDGTADSTSET